jgi:autotransporter-associated beta strand protein
VTATFTLSANRGIALTGAGTISPTLTLTYGGIIAGPGALTKAGAGTLILTDVNTYSGATILSAGTLSIAADSALGTAPGSATPGQLTFSAAATLLQQARQAHRASPEALEAAFLLIAETPQVWALDSASLVLPEHKDAIVVTGSHGGLLGGRPETALKYDVLGALYNDAGIGIDEAGTSRLPALDARGIAAATVSAASARIGDARSTYQDGIISRVNARAASLGLREGISTRDFVAGLRRVLAA